jgi:hypothetical protein
LEGYEHHLDHVLGRASATRQKYLYFARQFLSSYCGTGPLDWNFIPVEPGNEDNIAAQYRS